MGMAQAVQDAGKPDGVGDITPFTAEGARRDRRLVLRRRGNTGLSPDAGMEVHPHMLRHACGRASVNAGRDTRSVQAYIGHKNIRHMELYTSMPEDRFKHFWDGVKGMR